MGALAAASRPLKRDHPAASDPKLAVKILKEEAAKFPWIIVSAVGRDGRSVRSTLSDAVVEKRIAQMGGALGLAGILLLRNRLCIFTRSFTEGSRVNKTLSIAMEKLLPAIDKSFEKKLSDREDQMQGIAALAEKMSLVLGHLDGRFVLFPGRDFATAICDGAIAEAISNGFKPLGLLGLCRTDQGLEPREQLLPAIGELIGILPAARKAFLEEAIAEGIVHPDSEDA
jgi:hypothetical protein